MRPVTCWMFSSRIQVVWRGPRKREEGFDVGNIQMTQPCDEHAAMTSALPMVTSVHLAASRGRVQGISAFAARSVNGLVVRERSVDGMFVSAIDVIDLGAPRDGKTYNSKFAAGVRRSLLVRPPV